MKKTTLHKIGGYSLLLLAFALLVGPTLIVAQMRRPQLIALHIADDRPIALGSEAK